MAVTGSVNLDDGIYVPFMQEVRGGHDGKSPVGTVHQTLQLVGAAGGGTVVQTWNIRRIMFGFRAIIAPTLIVTEDTLSTAEAVKLGFALTANRRLAVTTDQAALAIAAQGGNYAKFEESGILLESDTLTQQAALFFTWSTNTDTKLYQARMFAAVFDAELIEAQGSISDFLAGVR